MTPGEYLRLPRRERRFCELFLVAEAKKMEASHKVASQGTEEQRFDARLQSWSNELSNQVQVH